MSLLTDSQIKPSALWVLKFHPFGILFFNQYLNAGKFNKKKQHFKQKDLFLNLLKSKEWQVEPLQNSHVWKSCGCMDNSLYFPSYKCKNDSLPADMNLSMSENILFSISTLARKM